jgi:RNA-binding motif X-linked protein 2
MVRDKESGKSKGFCFLKYDDQRSTVLAVDNFNGTNLLGRTLRVDHSRGYQQPKKKRRRDESESEESEFELDEEGNPRVKGFNVAPKGWLDPPVEETSEEEDDLEQGIDLDDPMRDFLIEKRREERGAEKKKHQHKPVKEKKERRHKHRRRSRGSGDESRRHGHRSDRSVIEGDPDRDHESSSRREREREPSSMR